MRYVHNAAVRSQAALTDSPRATASTPNAPAPAVPTAIQTSVERTLRMVDEFRLVYARSPPIYSIVVLVISRSRPAHAAHAARAGVAAWRRAVPQAVALAVGLALGCSSAGGPAALAQVRALPGRPGMGLSGQRVMVLPVSSLRGGDAAGWAAGIASPRDFLLDVNAQIARALPARAVHSTWVLPAEMARAAARNPGYAPDPYAVDVSALAPDRWRPGGQLADPLAGELRRLTSFTDARVALIPVELRFLPRADPASHGAGGSGGATPPGTARAVLRVALVDTRLNVVVWAGDVAGEPAPALTPPVAAALADRLADAMASQ
jgi:hypothetical protein